MGMARALTNMIGNCVATVVIGVWEKDVDRQLAHQVLNREIVVDLNDTDNGKNTSTPRRHPC